MVKQNSFLGIIIHDKFNIIQHKKFLSENAAVQEGKQKKLISENKDTKQINIEKTDSDFYIQNRLKRKHIS